MTDRRLRDDLQALAADPLAPHNRKPLAPAPVRPPLAGGRGEATADEIEATAAGGAGLDLPWSFVRNETVTVQKSTSIGGLFDEQTTQVLVLSTASGTELIIPTGL